MTAKNKETRSKSSTESSTESDGALGGGRRDDLPGEQAWLDDAYRHLERMQERAQEGVAIADRMVVSENTADAHVARLKLERRVEMLDVQSGPLCFGRIDTEDDERWYIGRRHVEDAETAPVMVDWRAPVAAAFYRATAADPFGLRYRRRFSLEDRTITALFDEDFEDPDSLSAAGIPDPLLAELDRSRSGQMRDIVATIASEQDEIIRAPLEELLVVQGGPGTGKTAVGLHRAAYLLYEYRRELSSGGPGAVADAGVLVLGPNPLFLRYISEVLPSLGEVAVRQATLSTLVAASYRVRSEDTDELRSLKGRPVMASLVKSACRAYIRPPSDGLELRSGLAVVRFDRSDIETLIKSVLSGGIAQNSGREVFRRRIVAEAWHRHAARSDVDPGQEPLFSSQLNADRSNRALIDKIWPTVSPTTVVRRLYASGAFRSQVCSGMLSEDEQKLLATSAVLNPSGKNARRNAEPWSDADIWLLDEAESVANGIAVTYGHIVVDEAQDLSPMALRMVGRRSARGSMTILGDLAQATRPGSVDSWPGAVEILTSTGRLAETSRKPSIHHTELTVGYRVPASIIDLANRLLPEAAPDVTPVVSVRDGGHPPQITPVTGYDTMADVAVREASRLQAGGLSVGVVAVADLHQALVDAAEAEGTTWRRSLGTGGGAGLPGQEAVVVLDPQGVKGLEFDGVVVVEPADIADRPAGLRHLYVAMTRSVHWLVVVHQRPLPSALVS